MAYPKFRLRIATMTLLVVVACLFDHASSQVYGQYKPWEVTSEQIQFLKWMDQLRLPELEKFTVMVEVREGVQQRPPLLRECFFVVGREDFVVKGFREDLTTRLINTEYFELWGEKLETINPIKFAEELLKEAQQIDVIQLEMNCMGACPKTIPEQFHRLSFWAWVCWRHQNYRLAGQLLTESERLYKTSPMDFSRDEDFFVVHRNVNHSDWVQEYLCDCKYLELKRKLADIHFTRNQLLNECAWFIEKFPRRYRAFVAEFEGELASMLVEDDLHTQDARRFQDLTKAEQIDELIFQLRDQTALEGGMFGSCSIFELDRHDTPAHRLVDYGYEAVPKLIDALSNTRLARINGSLTRLGNYGGGIARVNGCAAQILSEITVCDEPDAGFSYLWTRDDAPGLIDMYREWYARFLQIGNIEILAEGIAAADSNSARQALRLATKDPGRAVAAIEIGLNRAVERDRCCNLLEALAKIPGPESTKLLVTLSREAPLLDTRVFAAAALSHRGSDEGLKSALVEWHGARFPRVTDLEPSQDDFPRKVSLQLTYLFNVHRVEAIEAIAQRVQSDESLLGELLRLCNHPRYIRAGSVSETSFPDWMFEYPDIDPEEVWLQAFEKLLMDLVDFLDERSGQKYKVPNSFGQMTTQGIGEIQVAVASTLHHINPDRYPRWSDVDELAFDHFKQAWWNSLEMESNEKTALKRWPVLSPADLEQQRMANFAPKDIQTCLLEEAETGHLETISSPDDLVKIDPSRAIKAIRIGILRPRSDKVALISLLGRIPGDQATAALMEEVDQCSTCSGRIAAAVALRNRNHPAGFQAIIDEWRGKRVSHLTDNETTYRMLRSRALTQFFCNSGYSDCLQLIRSDLSQLKYEEKLDLLVLFSHDDQMNLAEGVTNKPRQIYLKAESPEWNHSLKQILLGLLNDESELRIFTEEDPFLWYALDAGISVEFKLVCPRICEIAALALRNLDEKRFKFRVQELETDPDGVCRKLKALLENDASTE